MALIRVPHRGPVYGGARTFRGDKRSKPRYVKTEQFDAPKKSDNSYTYVPGHQKRLREKR